MARWKKDGTLNSGGGRKAMEKELEVGRLGEFVSRLSLSALGGWGVLE